MEATTPQQLAEISGAIHDAYFDRDEVAVDGASAMLTLPFMQEAGHWSDGPEPELVRTTWAAHVYRVPLVASTLTIHGITDAEPGPGWGDGSMLDGIELASDGVLHVHGLGGEMRVKVRELRVSVEVTDEVVGRVRRRVGRLLGIEGDRLWRASDP